jgi:hypothetical protein
LPRWVERDVPRDREEMAADAGLNLTDVASNSQF